MNSPRIQTRPYNDLDLYAALMADMEYVVKNGKRPPQQMSKTMHVQKLLNDTLRFINVDFIQKKFGVNVPDGTPTSVAPLTDDNSAAVTLNSVNQTLASITLSPAYTSDIHVQGSVTINVTAGGTGASYVKSATIESNAVTIPTITIPAIQTITVDDNGAVTSINTTPAQTIEGQTFNVQTISKTTDNFVSDITLTVTLFINNVAVASYAQICGIGRNTLPFAFSLAERTAGDYSAALQASISGGAASVPMNGAVLQGWAQAILTASNTEG